MKLAISCIAWEQSDDHNLAQHIAEQGVQFIEVVPGRVDITDLNSIQHSAPIFKKTIEQSGLTCIAMQALLFGAPNLQLFDTDASRDLLLAHLSKVFAAGEILGVKRYVFGSPKNRLRGAIESKQAIEIAAEFFKAAAAIAAKHNGCLCIEANPAQYGGDFILNTAEAFELVQKVNHDGFGLHLDTGGMLLAGEDIKQIIQDYHSSIKHFHVSAPNLMPIYELEEISKIKDGLKILNEVGYQGFVSLEMKGLGAQVSSEERLKHVEKGLLCLKELCS